MLVDPKSLFVASQGRGLRQLLAAIALMAIASAPVLAAAVGMVTDLTGQVWLISGAIRQPLVILTYLEPGTVIEVDKAASVSITLYSPAEEHVFSGAAKFKIEKQGISKIGGAASVVHKLGATEADATAKDLGQGGRRTQAAVRMRTMSVGSVIAELSPDKTLVSSTMPRFSWRAYSSIPEYRLTVTAADGTPVVDLAVAGGEWRLPAEKALAPGKDYDWKVEATRSDGVTIGGKGRFRVLEAEEATRIAAAAPKGEASFSQRLRYAIMLEAAGLNEEARTLWRELARERPAEPAVLKRAQP